MKAILTISMSGTLAILTGCTGNGPSSTRMVPDGARFGAQIPSRPSSAPEALRKGIYVSDADAILGYRSVNPHNKPPACTVHGASPGGAIVVDGAGNLIDPDGGSKSVIVFKGPKMCGRKLGSFADPYGQPSDAASANAATSTIAVANLFDTGGAGSISICTMAGGCTANLTNPNMYEVAGVAMANNGDCWASATDSAGSATLTYFKKCSGSGQTATGYLNAYYGGLDIDSAGHLVSVSAFDATLYVYKGCKPACTLVGGPFALHGESVFGHLNFNSTRFAAADFQNGQVDVYRYAPTSLSYLYGFNNGFASSFGPDGVAYNPRSAL